MRLVIRSVEYSLWWIVKLRYPRKEKEGRMNQPPRMETELESVMET